MKSAAEGSRVEAWDWRLDSMTSGQGIEFSVLWLWADLLGTVNL